MDSHGEYSSLDRSRLLRSGLDGGSGGSSGSGSAGSSGSRPTSVSEYAGRAATPTTLAMAQYHSRYGLPSAMPGSNLAIMSSLLSGSHTSEARKALLIDFQQYWSAQADNFPRYLMAGSLYPPYPPILPGAAESLSLLGAGVACVAGGASTGAGPSQSQHVAHYQRLLEMQKEAYLASAMSAAANHHSALYGISATALPPFLDHTPFSSHGATPFSLVKQEPRELSCAEKTTKQGDRRAMGFKVDLDLNRGSKDTFMSSSSSLGNSQSTQLKEPKLSPSMSNGASAKLDKKGNNSSSSPGGGNQNVKKSFTHSWTSSSSAMRHNSDSVRSKCTSPSTKSTPQASPMSSSRGTSNSGSKKSGSKSSFSVSKHVKTSTSGHAAFTSSNLSMPSPSAVLQSESPIVSVPTQAAAPIPLATVQHDGVVLSALASPSSAAASLASTKPAVLKQQTDKLIRTSAGDKEPMDVGKSLSGANTSNGLSDAAQSGEHSSSGGQSIGVESRDQNASNSNINRVAADDQVDDSKVLSDDSSDIVVDSTENDDFPAEDRSPVLPRSNQDRSVEETIDKVTPAADSFTESDPEDAISPKSAKTSQDTSNTATLLSVSRVEPSCVAASSGSSGSTRAVYAKTLPVPSVTVSGCVQMTSSITSQASTSALPYYHTLYSKPQGVRRVHATTFVPEVGVFKGPSIKAMTKSSSSPSSSGTSALSPENRCRLEPRSASNLYSFSSDGHSRARDSTPSPSLMSPTRDLVSNSAYSSSTSPGIAHTTTEISSSLDSASLDSASLRSQSVASFHSAREVDESDDASDENENGLVIDHDIYDKNKKTDIQEQLNPTDCINDSLQTRDPEDDDDDAKKHHAVGDEDCSDATPVLMAGSGKDFMSRKGGKKDVVYGLPMPSASPDKSFTALESKVSFVPSDVSDKMCCDVAIDYSLPKSSCTGNITRTSKSSCDFSARTSDSSQLASTIGNQRISLDSTRLRNQTKPALAAFKELEQTPQKKHATLTKSFCRSSVTYSVASAGKLIISPTKPLIHQEVTGSTSGKSLPTPSSPHKRLKPNSNHLKLQVLTPASQDVLCKVSRRFKLQEDDGTKRCGSAPPAASASYFKPVKCHALPPAYTLSEKDFDSQERSENDHCLGNNIPVGIAVAQIRPHQIQQPRESQASDNLSRDIRHVHSSANTKNITQTTTSLATPSAAMAPSLVVAGRAVNPSPWLQQMPFTIHQAMNSSGATFDHSFPITAPSGFKFAHNSLTGQFFIVPTGDFVEQGGVWPAASFVPPIGAGNTHYQANINLPTVTISGPEGRDGRPKPEVLNPILTSNSGKTSAPENTATGNIIPEPDVISKDRTGLAKGGEKHHAMAHPNMSGGSNTSSLGLGTANTAATVVVNSVSSITAVSPPRLFKAERPTVESRGCSPVVFEDVASAASLLSTLSSLKSKKVTTCTIGIQTCDEVMKPSCKRKSSFSKIVSHDQGVQTSSPDLATLNPLSVQCPDLDSVDSLTHTLEVKTNSKRTSYNPFTDPQILQAADGLELLSTLAEKRTKCSSLDDPKRIFPSPSDSFKSDSASIVAIEDTLSPGDLELKSGQCTPRREVRRDLSPKWSLPKKEPPAVSVFADFKAPPDVDIPDDSEVRVKLAEVQRQYKEKQKELAKLQSKKSEESNQCKRRPGRPPKKKVHSKKSDDESSGCSSKTKDHHQPQKKKRPAEELVDMVFRKLPPVIKSSKVSRSIHYVKSKTGPFFRRKSASSSVKRNKDLFGFDESNWPSFSERKHQEKIKGKHKKRHRSSSSHSEDSKHSHDVGNIFANLESFGSDYIERREEALKRHSHKHQKSSSGLGIISIKTEPCSISSHQESGLGLLAKFALTVSTNSQPIPSISLALSSLTTTASSSTSTSGNQTSISSFSSSSFSTSISCSANYCSSLYNSCSSLYNMSGPGSGSNAPSITFGSLSSLMSSPRSGMMSFSSPNLADSSTPTTTSTPTFSPAAALATPATSVITSTTSSTASLSVTSASPLFPSPGAHHSSTEESSSGLSNSTTSSSSGSTTCSTSSSTTYSSTSSVRDISPFKRKCEEADSDTDTSDTSPNKKRKPGRPRKINPQKSSGGTETIWAKKSSTIGLLQVSEPSCSQAKEGGSRKLDPIAMKPLFLDEEWTRRRSERIFLNEPSPLPSPALSPSPRGEPVWKLSNFMPKSKKALETGKSIKEGDKDKIKTDSSKDQPPSLSIGPAKTSAFSSPTVSSSAAVKGEGKELISHASSVSWTLPAKSAEISTLIVDEAKLIVKLEDLSTGSTSSSASVLSSPEKSSSSHLESNLNKKKKAKKKMTKSELSTATSPSSPALPTLERKEKRAEEHSKIKLQKAKSLHDLTQRVKKKYSKARKQKDDQLKDSKAGKKKRKISTDSSDNDNLPLVSYRQGPPTPEPRTCRLQPSDLREGLKVLYLIDGLFHEGTVKALQPPDIYGVLTAGQRGNRPHILSLEEILKWAVMDVRPSSVRFLPEGARVCAFWSQQFSCLYPGTVANSSPIYNDRKVVIPVEFDDGDNGRIELDHIRLLPPDFPLVEYEPDPLQVLPKRKQRTLSDTSDVRKSVDQEPTTSKHSKTDEDDNDDDDDDDDEDEQDSKTDADSDESGSSGMLVRCEAWRWDGKSTKRHGLKGKGRKIFYKAITRGKETISVGDSAVFVSKDRVDCPYIGRIDSFWEGWNAQMMVKVRWYYHPEETESERKLADPKNALFESRHIDENDVQTIAYKCEVLSCERYKTRLRDAAKKGKPLKSNVFYMAGSYNPSTKNIKFYINVSSLDN